MDSKTAISLYVPDYVPEELSGWIEQQFNAGMSASEVIDIITTLHNNNTYYGGGGASPVWAVKKRAPNDPILELRMDAGTPELHERVAPAEETRTDDEIIEEALHAAINAGAKVIQDFLGATDGGFAGMHFSGGPDTDAIEDVLRRYLKAQRDFEEADAPIQGKDPYGLDQFPLNTVVRFKTDWDAFGANTLIKAGETGKVVLVDEEGKATMLGIEMDRYYKNLAEWQNQIHITVENGEPRITDILERVS